MIIVTGTKRSGTSMWMQILIGAGLPAFGEAFPGQWKKTIGQANPDGFYESSLRTGIYYKTNPHPQTGAYFFPEQVDRHVVKVFIPGLVRSDRAFIGKVVATMRAWREYTASLARLYGMEDERRPEGATPPVRMPAPLEWWTENFMLIRDIAIRRYPVHVQSYDGLLADPSGVIRKTVAWLGLDDIDVDAAVAAVKPDNRTQRAVSSEPAQPPEAALGLEADVVAMFDELYDQVHGGAGLTSAFIQKLNETNERLTPLLREHQNKVAADVERRRRAARPGSAPTRPDDTDQTPGDSEV